MSVITVPSSFGKRLTSEMAGPEGRKEDEKKKKDNKEKHAFTIVICISCKQSARLYRLMTC